MGGRRPSGTIGDEGRGRRPPERWREGGPWGESLFELRFQRPDESFTEWQIVDLHIEANTDPDFNGPGCPCTWYEASPDPVVVPAAAMISAP